MSNFKLNLNRHFGDTKVAPCAHYDIQLIWKSLTADYLMLLDRIKPMFLKRVLRLHPSTRNRLVFLLVGCQSFIGDLQKQFAFEKTDDYGQFIEELETRFDKVDPDFYQTPAMTSSGWRRANAANRHIQTRFAAHGFHHVLCHKETFHEPDQSCPCSLCGRPATRYHAQSCALGIPLKTLEGRASQPTEHS